MSIRRCKPEEIVNLLRQVEGRSESVLPRVNQEHLAQMVGTTRSRVSHFMSRFKKLGFVEYNGGLKVHSGLLTVILHD